MALARDDWTMDRIFLLGAGSAHHWEATYKTSFGLEANGNIQIQVIVPNISFQ